MVRRKNESGRSNRLAASARKLRSNSRRLWKSKARLPERTRMAASRDGTPLPGIISENEPRAEAALQTGSASSPETIRITLRVNGAEKQMEVAPWTTLLDALREQLDLTGTKKGCDHGQCGACTVLVNGKRMLSCLTLAVIRDGAEVTTIEGLAAGDELHALQAAFMEHDAFQCGYCTPGQICSAVGLIREGKARTLDDIRELMSGNLCRCGAYPNIVAAVQQAKQAKAGSAKR
jgi:xanthine dehydrogenase YagT iron-sulfur-binding subunit